MDTTGRRILCMALALTSVMSLYGGSISAAPVTTDTGDVTVRIRADKPTAIISPYIYGINDKGDISGATVLKQYGAALPYLEEKRLADASESLLDKSFKEQ